MRSMTIYVQNIEVIKFKTQDNFKIVREHSEDLFLFNHT